MVAPVFSDGDLGPDIRRKLNEMGVAFEAAIAGAYGPQGWAPKLLVASDGERRVLQLVDWISGQGTKPTLLGYLGNVGIVSDIAEAIDIRGATGATGPNGADGVDGTPVELQTSATHIQWRYVGSGTWTNLVALSSITGATGADGTNGIDGSNGWTPVFANVADGSRFVQQITDWVGGEGTKPATGKYVGATGLVTLIADAVNIRGASGAGSGDVTGPVSSTTGHIAVFADGTGKVLSSGGALGSAAFVDTSAFATAAQGIKADTAIQSTEKGTANGVASLGADNKIPSSQLPSIAITDVFVVGSETAMLELTAQKGDIAVRSDLEKTYALSAEPAATLANWVLLRTPTDSVLSVAGRTGVVTLVKGDVGLSNVDNTADSAKPVSTATQTALDAKQDTLVSGTTVKTVGGSSLLGSGNISVLPEAPSDGKTYGRKDAAWAEVVSGGGGSLTRSARTSNTALTAADKGKLIDITSGAFDQEFDSAATLGAGWWCYLRNSGSGDIGMPTVLGAEIVSNGNVDQYGADVVVNGGFDADTNWTKGAGWTISGGKAVATATTANLTASVAPLASGTMYRVTFDCTVSSGTFRVLLGTLATDVISASGTYTVYGAANSTALAVDGVSAFTGTIDNIVVQPLTGWSFVTANASVKPAASSFVMINYAQATAVNALKQTIPAMTAGAVYDVTYTITRTSGDIRLSFNDVQELSDRNASGTYTERIVASAAHTSLHFEYATAFFTGTISAISIKKVTNAIDSDDGDGLFVMYPGEARLVQSDGSALRTVVLSAFSKTYTASGIFYRPTRYRGFDGLLWGAGGNGAIFSNLMLSSGSSHRITGGSGGACNPFKASYTTLQQSSPVLLGSADTFSSIGPFRAYSGTSGVCTNSWAYYIGGGGILGLGAGATSAGSATGGKPASTILGGADYQNVGVYGGGCVNSGGDKMHSLYGGAAGGDFTINTTELIQNPEFSTDTVWVKDSGWAISGDTASVSNTTTATLTQTISGLSVGSTYVLQGYAASANNLRVFVGAFASTGSYADRTGSGYFTVPFVATQSTMVVTFGRASTSNLMSCTIDNVFMRLVTVTGAGVSEFGGDGGSAGITGGNGGERGGGGGPSLSNVQAIGGRGELQIWGVV